MCEITHLTGKIIVLKFQTNMHPVKVALDLKKLPPLMEHLSCVKKVLEMMSEKEMKRGMETNEVMSFKLHYFSCIVAEIAR